MQQKEQAISKLSDHVEIFPGFAFKSDRFSDDPTDMALVKGENVHQGYIDWDAAKRWPAAESNVLHRYELLPGDIVIAMDRPWVTAGLKWAYIRENDPAALLVQRVARLRSKGTIDQRYLRFLISSKDFAGYIEPIVTGVNVPHISAKQIGDFSCVLPALKVQERIAGLISPFDDLIENNKRRIALLEKVAEEIYREWFVRMRFPGHDAKRSEGQEIGDWRTVSFDELCTLKRGYDLPDAMVKNGPFPVIASTSIKAYHREFKVEPPVITTGRSGSLGSVLLVRKRAWPLNTTLYVKNFLGNSAFFIYYTLKNMRLEGFNSGAGVPTLNRNHLSRLPFVLPPTSVQLRFDDVMEGMHGMLDVLRDSSEILSRTRDLLLPRLISGKLSVENLDIQFPPSMRDVEQFEMETA